MPNWCMARMPSEPHTSGFAARPKPPPESRRALLGEHQTTNLGVRSSNLFGRASPDAKSISYREKTE
jgi:hypothetical protein